MGYFVFGKFSNRQDYRIGTVIMTGIEELTAIEETVTIDGKEWTVKPLDGGDYARIKKRILSERANPHQAAREMTELFKTPEERMEFAKWAFDAVVKAQRVSARELDEFMSSIEGACYCFYLALREKHPGVTEDQAAKLLEHLGQQKLQSVLSAMREQFPEVTDKQIKAVMQQHGDAFLGELLGKISGMPAGNSESPTPETTDS